jgi:glycosyltransferase involved in cell wall biosynthesis
LKIVYLSNSTIPSREANSVHVMKMCQAFAKLGHQVFLISKKRNNNTELDGQNVFLKYEVAQCFELITIPFTESKIARYIYGLKAALKAKSLKADLVYGRDLLSCFFASLFGLKTVYELHYPLDPNSTFQKIWTKKMVNMPNFLKLVVISDALKKYVINTDGLNPTSVIVAHDGADPLKSLPTYIEKTKGLRLNAAYIGSLYPGKGMELIVKMALITKNVDFHIIGGRESDIDLWKNRIGKEVPIIFHGFKTQAELAILRSQFDVLLAPYLRNVSMADGFGDLSQWMSPLKIFEYMATGIPMLCSDLPVIQEVLKNDETAFLLSPDNPIDWATMLEKLFQYPELGEKVAQNAKTVFLENYTWKKRADKLLKELD